MLALDIKYNNIKEDIKTRIISFTLSDNRSSSSSTASLVLADYDGRFSRGQWRAFTGDGARISIGGADFGEYTIDKTRTDNNTRAVTWEMNKRPKNQESTKTKQTPTKGQKPPVNGGKLTQSGLNWGRLPTPYTLNDLCSRISDYTGTRVTSHLTRERGPWRVDDESPKSKNPSLAGLIVDSTESPLGLLSRVATRLGADIYSDGDKIKIIEGRTTKSKKTSAKGEDVDIAPVKVEPMDVVSFNVEEYQRASGANSSRYTPNKAVFSVDVVNSDGRGVMAQVDGAVSGALGAIVEDITTAERATCEILPRAGLMAGCVVAFGDVFYEVARVDYSTAVGTEKMTLTLERKG